jgi:sulfite reductase (NADPH) hemoprotein beta-component
VATHASTLGSGIVGFADANEIDVFIETLARFERGELDPDAWRAFRLVSGTYGQRQPGDLSMLRAKIPQGILSAGQLEAVADVADTYSRGFVHLTTRQNIQIHFIPLGRIGDAMHALGAAGLTTREACGNSVRNVTTSPTAGVAADEVFDATPYADAFTRYFLRHPKSASLPRKFKVAFSGGGADHSFALVNDIGWHARIADVDGVPTRGFRVTVGGGTALWCQSGLELFDFVPARDLLVVAEAVLRVFDAHGDRVNRKKNRLRYLIKQMGWERWRAAFFEELARAKGEGIGALPFDPEHPPDDVAPPSADRARPRADVVDAILAADAPRGPGIVPRALPVLGDDRGERFRRGNVKPQRQDGYVTVTVTVPLGDLTSGRLRVLAIAARSFADGEVRTTAGQNVLLRWVRADRVDALYALLRRAGLAEPDPESLADVTSCPGAESCKLAVTQSRGLASSIGEHFRADRALVDRAPGLVVKVSGCPNGCGLHHVAGLGFQGGLRKVEGKPVPQYHLYVGGDPSGAAARFGKMVAKIPARRVPQAIERIVALYEDKRAEGETITAFLGRVAPADVKAVLKDIEALDATNATPEDFVDLGETTAFVGDAASEGECAA